MTASIGGLRASKTTTAALAFANYDEDLDLGRLRKPDFPGTVDCRFSLRNLCGGPRYRSDVDVEHALSVAIYDFAVVDSGFVAFLLVHTPRRRPRRPGGPEEVTMCGEPLVGDCSSRPGDSWLAASSQSLGGSLVPIIGPNFVFALNAACFLVVILAILRWKRIAPQPRTGLESFFVYFLAAVRYVRYAPGLQIVLARNALFAMFISVIPALMPVVGLRALHLDPSQLGLLFASLGAGSVAGASLIIPWLRARY